MKPAARSNSLSVVIPALNEAAIIADTLRHLQTWRADGVEVLLVDGGSADETVEMAAPLVDRVISAAPGRARQMNRGWKAAAGELLWFLHADTAVTEAHRRALLALPRGEAIWGWFDIQFDSSRWVFGRVAALMNWRSRVSGVATGDQGLFVSRGMLEAVGGFPEIPLMEDVAICRRLKSTLRGRPSEPALITSSRRWERHGVGRTILLMWYLRAAFFFGADPARLASRYRHAR